MRPDTVCIIDDGAVVGSVTGSVIGRTFRRDHFLVGVIIDDVADEPVQVEVSVDAARIPDVGERVALIADDLVHL